MTANSGGRGPVTNVNAPAKKRPVLLMAVLGIVAVAVIIAVAVSVSGSKTPANTDSVLDTTPNAQAATTPPPAGQAIATGAPASPPTQVAVTAPSGGTGANYVGPTATGAMGLAPHLGEVMITSDAAIQSRGGQVSVAVRAKPNTACTIKVQYLSGNATAPGLEPKSSDASGKVSWSWVIAQDAKSGTWPITVTCGKETANTTVTVP